MVTLTDEQAKAIREALVFDTPEFCPRAAKALAILDAESAPQKSAKDARELDFDFFWQIVVGWSQDMPRVGQKLSVHEMRTLVERLLSITLHRLAERAPSPSGEGLEEAARAVVQDARSGLTSSSRTVQTRLIQRLADLLSSPPSTKESK